MTHIDKLDLAIRDISDILRNNGFKSCEVLRWEESAPNMIALHDHNGCNLNPEDTYVVITCENDYHYYINITGSSVLSACAEVLSFIQYK